jgi:hypothetical protein
MVPLDPTKAAQRVLEEAPKSPRFLDLTEAERLIWMLERAFVLGMRAAGAGARRPGTQRNSKVANQKRVGSFGSSFSKN